MEQTKITKILRPMKLITHNVSYRIDQFAVDLGIKSLKIYRYT